MTHERTRKDPARAEEPNQAATAAMEEFLSRSTVDALLHISMEDVVGHNPEAEVVKGKAYRSGGWLHAPARLELFAVADRRLTRVAQLAGLAVKRVERVRPMLVKGTRLLVLQAAAVDDLSAVPVHRYAKNSTSWTNLIQLLGGAGLAVETGYRERYEVAYVPTGSPLWPGLVIDLSQPLERRLESKARKNWRQAESAAAASADNSSPKQGSGPAAQ